MKERDKLALPKPTTPIPIKKAIPILTEVHGLLKRIELRYWLGFGTWLGFYRDGGIIPWDTDVDFMVLSDDTMKLQDNKELFKSAGFEVGAGSTITSLLKDGVLLDFYHMNYENGGRRWQGFCFAAGLFDNSEVIERYGLKWNMIQNTEGCLTYIYGASWREPIMGRHAEMKPME